MYEYFKTFPIVFYGDSDSRNLILRAGMAREIIDKYGIFYPYKVKDHERMDTIAFDYYGDSSFYWIIALANDIVDPYTDWPMSDAEFNAYINSKYGSFQAAASTIHHYANTDSSITRQMSPVTRALLDPIDRIGFDLAVSSYDWESGLNEDRKSIKLLSRKYAQRAYDELRSSFLNDRS